jgi:putative hemin transport protein
MTERTTVESRNSGTNGSDAPCEHRRSNDQRALAASRGITEAELVAAWVGVHAIRLRPEWQPTLHRLGAVGRVLCLTANDHATIESVARYRDIATWGPAAQVADGDTDLCLFFSEWHTGFAVRQDDGLGPRRSLQFFDARGGAVHKVFLLPSGDRGAFDELVVSQTSRNQSTEQPIEAGPPERTTRPPLDTGTQDDSLPVVDNIDIAQAHLFAGPMWSKRVAKISIRHVLEAAIVSRVPLLIMVGNHGALQIHNGPVGGVQHVDGWLTIQDAAFNLHLDESGIASAWVVRKATPDGVVTSLELYDGGGEMIVYLARL